MLQWWLRTIPPAISDLSLLLDDFVFCGFMLGVDGYPWKAIYIKAGQLEQPVEEG